MAKPPKDKKPEDIETEPDAWDRFERSVERMIPPKRKPGGKGKKEKGDP